MSVGSGTNYTPLNKIITGNGDATFVIANASAAWTPGLITNGTSASVSVTPVPGSGSLRGCPAIGSFSEHLPAGCFIQATSTSATNMRVTIFNMSGGDVTIAAGTASVLVFRGVEI